LETLDLAKNRLKAIANLEKLELLEELWLNHNGVDDWKNIELLKVNKALQTIYLEYNPLAKDVRYRSKLRDILPQLEKIDATLCKMPGT